MTRSAYDAVVVGSGPNGLATAITLQRQGLSVLLIEGKETIGGGMRSAELTLPGFVHDICSAIHPLALLSPFFRDVPLHQYGLEFIQPAIACAHPFDDGTAAILDRDIEKTADSLGADRQVYLDFMQPLMEDIPALLPALLGPFRIPKYPVKLGKFGLKALPSARWTARLFKTMHARGLWAGIAAHSIQPLSNTATSAFGIMLAAAAHLKGWPVPKGGSQAIANALLAHFKALGGEVQTGWFVKSVDELPKSKAVLLDVTPRQLISIAGSKLSAGYVKRLNKYRYGPGIFKIDWALDGQIPFRSAHCRNAGTVHLGNSLEEIASYEKSVSNGNQTGKPFVLLAQQSLFDKSRAPEGKHVAWGYCHVPNGSELDMTDLIEDQVERFAPSFRDLILARKTMNTTQIEQYNPNYPGGDINGGIQDIFQLYTRPVLSISPYRTSAQNIYLCSSSTPPGGGVHGMCGYHAGRQVLKDIFGIHISA